MRFILSFLFVFLFMGFGFAQTNTSSVFRFLDVTPTAQTASLGGNHTGLFDANFSAMHLNPAYLDDHSAGFVSASYVNFLGGAHMGFSSAAFKIDQIGVIGIGIRYVGYGDFDELDESGNKLGNFNANDIALTGTYSYTLNEQLRAGAAVDLIHSSLGSYRSSAAALSAGLYYKNKEDHLSAGLVVKNAGAQITTFDNIREPLPFDVSFGLTKKPEAFPFEISLTLKRLNDWDMRIFGETERPAFGKNLMRHVIIGGQTNITENVTLRLGYDHYLHAMTETGKTIDLAGLSFGLGFTIKDIVFDLSRHAYSQLGGVTMLTVRTKLFN